MAATPYTEYHPDGTLITHDQVKPGDWVQFRAGNARHGNANGTVLRTHGQNVIVTVEDGADLLRCGDEHYVTQRRLVSLLRPTT